MTPKTVTRDSFRDIHLISENILNPDTLTMNPHPYTVSLTHESGNVEHFLIRANSEAEACDIAPRHSWLRRDPIVSASATPGISHAHFLMESRCFND